MIHQVCPNPALLQQLYAGPLSDYVETFAHQLLAHGYAMPTAKFVMRLLADLSRWIEEQALTAMDLNEQRVEDFLQDRPIPGQNVFANPSGLSEFPRRSFVRFSNYPKIRPRFRIGGTCRRDRSRQCLRPMMVLIENSLVAN